jgi:F-type H+-transporting ATPase subunit b
MRSLLLPSLALAAALAAGAPAPAAAEEPTGAEVLTGEKTPAADHGGGKAKEPGIFALALDLTLWTIVVFLLLLFVLRKYAWGPMLEGLTKREQDIHAAADEAKQARDEAKRLREEFERKSAEAEQRARDIIDEARRNAQKAADETRSKTMAEIQSERERLHREVENARDQALQQIWAQAAQLATLVSAKAIGRQLDHDDHRRLVDEAIADLRQAAARRNGEPAGV